MDFAQFSTMRTCEVANLVQQNGRKTVAFALNGTRRWFLLENVQVEQEYLPDYYDVITTRLAEILAMLFEHGIHTVLLPILSPHLFDKRGEIYTKSAVGAIPYITTSQKFLEFYQKHDVCVRFYGDYEPYLDTPAFRPILEQMNRVTSQTAQNRSHRLYWGVCAHDATQTTITYTARHINRVGTTPTKAELITAYYGEPLEAVDIFITASKFRVFDIPLLSNGREDLYFTVAPSPYFSKKQLRAILYDHLFHRKAKHLDYNDVHAQQWEALRRFYRTNIDQVFGVGNNHKGFWLPNTQLVSPQEELPTP